MSPAELLEPVLTAGGLSLNQSTISSDGAFAMSFITELLAFARARKKFWLLPLLTLLAIFGGLLILAKGSAVAPFIYTIF